MPRRLVPYLAFLAVALLSTAANRWHDASASDGRLQSPDGGDTVRITPEIRHAALRFAPEVSPADRAWVEAAILAARPEAQRLIHEVDGMVTVTTAGSGAMIGLTKPSEYGFTIWLNVARLNGTCKLDRATAVLHEFGHVIDFA